MEQYNNTNGNAPATANPDFINMMRNLLVDFAWIYESRRTAYDFQSSGDIVPNFPDSFLSRAMNENILRAVGMNEVQIGYLFSIMNDRNQVEYQLTNIFKGALERTFGPVPEPDKDGNPQVGPLRFQNGTVNAPAMMRMFRKVRNENAKRTYAIRNGRLKESAPYIDYPDEFVALLGDRQFQMDIGLQERNAECLNRALGYYYQKRNSGQFTDEDITIMNKTISKYIGGKENDGIFGVFSSGRINKEFRHRKTGLQLFIDEFKAENNRRMANKVGNEWPPFSDAFIMKAYDRNLLQAIGMSEEGINAVFRTKIPASGLDDNARKWISINLGRYGKTAEMVVNNTAQHQRQTLDSNSGIVSVYRELYGENSESFAMKKQHLDMDKMRYSDSLIDRLFETPLLDPARRSAGNNFLATTKQWIMTMPDDSVLPTIGFTRQRLLNVVNAIEQNPNLTTPQIIGIINDPDAVYVESAMHMLVIGGYESGASENFWNKLSPNQRTSFRTAIGKSILGAFKNYRDQHRDIFPQRSPQNGNGRGWGEHGRNDWNGR